MKNIKKFETESAYNTYINDNPDKPNVSYIVETNEVEYNPINSNIYIRYTASAKLIETTDKDTPDCLHTNVFNTAIKSHTFKNGVGIIEFNDEVTSVGQNAFMGCRSLISITLPSSITSIASDAFSTSTLESIICNATIAPTIKHDTFYNIKANGTLYVPTGSTGYDVWMSTNNFYLGSRSWIKVEQ